MFSDIRPSDIEHRHDFNPTIGGIDGLEPFQVLYPEAYSSFEKAFLGYIKQIKELEKTPAQEVQVVKAPSKYLDLPRDMDGFPLIPPAPAGRRAHELKYHKQVVRSFIAIHYGVWTQNSFTAS